MEYSVFYQKRKSITATIEDGKVVIKAPLWLDKESIEAFVLAYREALLHLLAKECRKVYLGCLTTKSDDELKQKAKVYLPARTLFWSQKMGMEPTKIKISSAKKRWGSCSSRGHINLSFRLMRLPLYLIDYVIIHELCHLEQMNHSKAFWALVEKYCPYFRACEKELKQF